MNPMFQRPARFTELSPRSRHSSDAGMDIPLTDLRNSPTKRFSYRLLKRFLDFCVSLLALTLLAPFLALIALALRLGSSAPVFFRQRRVGQYGREFWMYKFTTMM